jgi:hypothetical protein
MTENNFNNSITISPNPFTSQTVISFSQEQKNTTISIMDFIGREIETISFSGRQYLLDKGEMSSGVYFVRIEDEKRNVANKKIILE